MFAFDEKNCYLNAFQNFFPKTFRWKEWKTQGVKMLHTETKRKNGQKTCTVPKMPKIKGRHSEETKGIKIHAYSQAIKSSSNLNYVTDIMLNSGYGNMDNLLTQILENGISIFKSKQIKIDPETP